jgi:hypothetical protein
MGVYKLVSIEMISPGVLEFLFGPQLKGIRLFEQSKHPGAALSP